jgi:hypothetical protein
VFGGMHAPRTKTRSQRPALVNCAVLNSDVALLPARPFLGLVLLRLLDFLAALILARHCVPPSSFVRIVTGAGAAVEGPYGATASARTISSSCWPLESSLVHSTLWCDGFTNIAVGTYTPTGRPWSSCWLQRCYNTHDP